MEMQNNIALTYLLVPYREGRFSPSEKKNFFNLFKKKCGEGFYLIVTNIWMKIRVRKSVLCNFNSGKYLAIYILADFNDGETRRRSNIKRDLWWERVLALNSVEVL